MFHTSPIGFPPPHHLRSIRQDIFHLTIDQESTKSSFHVQEFSMYHKPRKTKDKVHFALEDSYRGEGSSSEEETKRRPPSPLRSPPPAPMPSPTSSGSSESTAGPLTPPDSPYYMEFDSKDTPYLQHGSPPPTKKPRLAPILSSGRHMHWDMVYNPLNALKHIPLDGGNDRAGCMPSGEPITDMEVIFDEALADWPLRIRAAKGQALTIQHVWLAIHEHLMKYVSKEHFDDLPPELHERVRAALSARRTEVDNSKEPLRRIDYMPNRIYVGLSANAGENGWEYHLTCHTK